MGMQSKPTELDLFTLAQANLKLLDGLLRLAGGARYEDVELKVGDEADLSSLKTVAKVKGASGKTTFKPDQTASGQYVLIWFTRLPADAGKFRGTIYEVVVHSPGSA